MEKLLMKFKLWLYKKLGYDPNITYSTIKDKNLIIHVAKHKNFPYEGHGYSKTNALWSLQYKMKNLHNDYKIKLENCPVNRYKIDSGKLR